MHFRINKPVCAECTVHCFKPDMRSQIRDVMRFAGPGLLSNIQLLATQYSQIQYVGCVSIGLTHQNFGCRDKCSQFPTGSINLISLLKHHLTMRLCNNSLLCHFDCKEKACANKPMTLSNPFRAGRYNSINGQCLSIEFRTGVDSYYIDNRPLSAFDNTEWLLNIYWK